MTSRRAAQNAGHAFRKTKVKLDAAHAVLRVVQWLGYDIESGERCCPVCDVWKFQPDNPEKSIHGFACSLAVAIGAETELGIEGDTDDV